MPTHVDPPEGFPPPGTAVRSPSGRIGAAVHNGFPGVLLGVWDAGTYRLGIERLTIGGPSEWVRVRTADPVWLSAGGQGAAYDLEVEPGQTYIYRPTYGGKPNPAHEVMVAIPGWGAHPQDALHTGWLKSVAAPQLSRRVRMGPPSEFTHATHSAINSTWGSRYASATWGGRAATRGQFVVHALPGDNAPALLDLLSSGVLLWQPRPAIETKTMYILPGDVTDRHYGGLSPARRFTLDYTEVARPAGLDSPPVVPAWTWAVATAGLDVAVIDSLYPDQWSILLEGVQRWEPDSVGTA